MTTTNMKGKTVKVKVIGLKKEKFAVGEDEYIGCPICRTAWEDSMDGLIGKTSIVEIDILNDTDTDFVGAQIGDEAYNMCIHALEIIEVIKSYEDMIDEMVLSIEMSCIKSQLEMFRSLISGLRDRIKEAEEAGSKGIMDHYEVKCYTAGIKMGIGDLEMYLCSIEQRKQTIETRMNGKK